MTPISKVPEELLNWPPTPSEDLEKICKELEELNKNRRPFIELGQEKIYLDESEEYYQNLTEEQVQFLRDRVYVK